MSLMDVVGISSLDALAAQLGDGRRPAELLIEELQFVGAVLCAACGSEYYDEVCNAYGRATLCKLLTRVYYCTELHRPPRYHYRLGVAILIAPAVLTVLREHKAPWLQALQTSNFYNPHTQLAGVCRAIVTSIGSLVDALFDGNGRLTPEAEATYAMLALAGSVV